MLCVRKEQALYTDRSAVICAGAATEVEALKKALAEAEGKAVEQQAAQKKLESRVKEVRQEVQDAVIKCETLEHDASTQGAELTRARQSTETARNEPRPLSRRSRRPRRSRRVRPLRCKASMRRSSTFY